MGYIIAKYAEDYYPNGKAPAGASIKGTFTAKECGVETDVYASIEAAQADLERVVEFNPSVGYGILEAN